MMTDEHGRARVFRQAGDSDELIAEAVDTCPVDCIWYVSWEDLVILENEREYQVINNQARLVGGSNIESTGWSGRGGWGVYANVEPPGKSKASIMNEGGMRCNNCPGLLVVCVWLACGVACVWRLCGVAWVARSPCRVCCVVYICMCVYMCVCVYIYVYISLTLSLSPLPLSLSLFLSLSLVLSLSLLFSLFLSRSLSVTLSLSLYLSLSLSFSFSFFLSLSLSLSLFPSLSLSLSLFLSLYLSLSLPPPPLSLAKSCLLRRAYLRVCASSRSARHWHASHGQ